MDCPTLEESDDDDDLVDMDLIDLDRTSAVVRASALPPAVQVGWHYLDISPAERGLAAEMMQLAANCIQDGSKEKYAGAWAAFVRFCELSVPPRTSMPASPTTVALYLTRRGQEANSYSVIKTASGAIYHYHRISLTGLEPTSSPMVALIVWYDLP